MGRRAAWPPKVTPHRASGRDRVRWAGRDYYLGPIGSAESRAKYLELIRELEAAGACAPAPRDAPLTVAQLVMLWDLHALAEYGPASQEVVNYRAALRPVLRHFEALPAAEFGGPQLRAARAEMLATGWCRPHVNRCVVRVRTVWRWAEEEGHAPPGAWAALRAVRPLDRPRPGVSEGRPNRPAEWWRVARAAFLGAAPGLRLYALLAWHSGARPGELCGLTAGMIDATGPVWAARLAKHKCAWRGHSRTLFFGPECQELLRPRLAECGPDDFVCTNAHGGPFDRRTVRQALHRACKAAGVEPINPYQTRHSFAARVTKAAGLDAARAALGHKSVSMTGHYSASADADLAAEAAKRVG